MLGLVLSTGTIIPAFAQESTQTAQLETPVSSPEAVPSPPPIPSPPPTATPLITPAGTPGVAPTPFETTGDSGQVNESTSSNKSLSPGQLPTDTINQEFPGALVEGIQYTSQVKAVDPSASIRPQVIVNRLSKKNFRADEAISVIVENTFSMGTKITLFDVDGEEVPVEVEIVNEIDPTVVKILPPSNLKPGRYRLKIVDPYGGVTTQHFTWGVLAINTNKSIYKPFEEAKIAIAVLDEIGNMTCDASLSLEITNSELQINDNLSTNTGEIKVNANCKVKAMILEPDYEARYTVGETGTYKMTLTAETGNGTYSISDSFEVQNEVSFDVERESATRIYPPERYPVRLNIVANEDFEGVITEIVPENFLITPLLDTLAYDNISTIEDVADPGVLGESDVQIGLPFSGEYPISQKYGGLHDDPLLREKYKDYGVVGHDGVDFQMDPGTEILAADDGEVVRARENSDYGTTVVIQHDWGKSYYGHLSEIKVKESDRVKKGDIIALSGSTGLSTNPHFHFGVKPLKNDVSNGYYGKVNPLPYLGLEKKEIKVLGAEVRSSANSGVQIITWNVKLSKGESITLGYRFKMPDESPQFYLTGPLEFRETREGIKGPLIFKEARQWQLAADAVDPITGWLNYGDTANAGKVKTQDLSDNSPISWGAEVNTALGGGATNIFWTKTVADSEGTEIHTAYIDSGGTMYVLRCTGACRTTGNWSELFNVAGVSPTQTCTGTSADCNRPFDIAYEQLTGRVMIAYAKNATNDAFFYRIYNDGTQSVGETQVSDTNLGGDAPTFISLKPRGERLATARTNQILLTAMANGVNNEVVAHIWSGSAWGNSVQITATTNSQLCIMHQCADGAWELADTTANGVALVAWSGTDTNIYYRRYTGSWASEATSAITKATSTNAVWIQTASDPASNRIALAMSDEDGLDYKGEVWKADGSTAGWTASTGDLSAEANLGQNAWVVWERTSNDAITLYGEAANTLSTGNETADCSGAGCTFTVTDNGDTSTACTGGTAPDDSNSIFGYGAWNSNEVMFAHSDIDSNLFHRRWSGTALDAATTTDCREPDMPPNPASGFMPNTVQSFVWDAYKPWQRNWRFYDDETVNDPSVGLNGAAEDVTPTDVDLEEFIRLKAQLVELGDKAQTDTRKKLQYTSGCTPNTASNEILCTWTDVGDVTETSAVWRYASQTNDGVLVCSSCNDNTAVATPRLTGSEAGFYITDKDAAGNTAMDHGDAGSITDLIEVDYPLKAENVVNSTTYYFRVVDVDTTTELAVNYRRQDTGTTDCLGATCTYPSLTIVAAGGGGPTLDQLMRHGGWFNASGIEQPFTF